MDIVSFFGSFNKISLIAFLITLVFLVWEFKLLSREKKQRSQPKIPKFDESGNPEVAQGVTLATSKNEKIVRPNNLIFIILIILVIVFGGIFVLGFTQYGKKSTKPQLIQPQNVLFVSSKGIKIFDKSFNPLTDNEIAKIKAGDTIIIGVESITGVTDLDRARIRVNRNSWSATDAVSQYDSKNKVYFKEYQVASGEAKLKIEAQLHSVTDGWLGEE